MFSPIHSFNDSLKKQKKIKTKWWILTKLSGRIEKDSPKNYILQDIQIKELVEEFDLEGTAKFTEQSQLFWF